MIFKRSRQASKFRSIELPHKELSFSCGKRPDKQGGLRLDFDITATQTLESKQTDNYIEAYESYTIRLQGIEEIRRMISALQLAEGQYKQGIFDGLQNH